MCKKVFVITLLLFATMLLFGAIKCLAADSEQSVVDNRASIAVQKQPSNKMHNQEAKQNKWCIIIQVNGKVKDTAGTNAK